MNHRKVLNHHRHQVGCFAARCNAVGFVLGTNLRGQMYHGHLQKLRFLLNLEGFGKLEQIQHGRILQDRLLKHYHDRAKKMLRIRQLQETMRDHKELPETWHNLGKAARGDLSSHHMAHLHNFLRRIADTDSCMQHNRGSNSKDGRRGSCRLELAVDDRAGAERLVLPQAADFGWQGSGSCDRRSDPPQLSHIETGSVGHHSEGIVKFLLLEDRCNHCKIVAEMRDRPAVLEHLAALRTVGCCNRYCRHYAVAADRRCNIGRIRSVRKKTLPIAATVATETVGFGNLRRGFETKELAD